jgi:hypothetical protein
MRFPVLVFAFCVIAVSAQAAELRCIFQSRNTCSPKDCTPGDPSTAFVVLRPETNQYGRCGGSKPCDWLSMTVKGDGNDSFHQFTQRGVDA